MSRALILVDHGSRRAEANAALDQMVRLIGARRSDLMVAGAHMELARPDLAETVARLVEQGAREVIVLPFMLAPGRHATIDIPEQVAALAARYGGVVFRITDPLGPHEGLVNIVLERSGLFAEEGPGHPGRAS